MTDYVRKMMKDLTKAHKVIHQFLYVSKIYVLGWAYFNSAKVN